MKRPKYLSYMDWVRLIRRLGLDQDCQLCLGWGCQMCDYLGEIYPNLTAYDIQREIDEANWRRYNEQFERIKKAPETQG